MTSKESLRIFCSECERKMARNKIRCPFRSILNDFCGEYEIIEKDLERLEKLEKENQKLKEQVNRFQKVIEDIKNLPDYIGIGFKNMFDNCKLTPLPESPELENELKKLRSYKNDSCR